MQYAVEISPDEHALISACMLSTVRLFQERALEHEAINFTTAAAECISNLNSGKLHVTDVEFIIRALQKTEEQLRKDTVLPKSQLRAVRASIRAIQHKLQGPRV